MKKNHHIGSGIIILIGIYIILIIESLYKVYSARQNNISLKIEIAIAITALIIYFFISQMQSSKKTLKVQEELDTLAKRVLFGVAKISLDDDLTLHHANNAFFSIFGCPKEDFNNLMENKTALFIHPGDLAYVRTEMMNQANLCADISIDYRIIINSGEIRWVHLDGFFSEIINKTPIYNCIYTDITDFQESLQQSEMEKERYRILTELSDDILFEYDIENHTLTASQVFISTYGMNPTIPEFRKTIIENNLIHHSDKGIFNKLCDSMDKGDMKICYELRFRLTANSFTWYQIQGTALMDKRGEPIKIIGKAVNIDSQKRETESLEKKAQLDPLTGVYNKVVTGELIDEYISEKNNDSNKLSALFVIDIDNFKGINDNLGHLFGDKVLTDISKKVKSIIKDSDIIGRIGGDEFVVFLKDIRTKEFAIHKAEEIRIIFNNAFTGENNDYKISGSIGVALYPSDGAYYDELFVKADEALYEAKNYGKNCFAFSGEKLSLDNSEQYYNSLTTLDNYNDLSAEIKLDEILLTRIFELLTQNSLTYESLNNILQLIKDYYNVSRAYIVELPKCNRKKANIFCWCRDKYALDNPNFRNTPNESWNSYLNDFNSEGIYILENLHKNTSPFYNEDVKSTLQCKIINQDSLEGILIIDDFNETHLWTKYQVRTFIFLSKVIGYHLKHLQTQKRLQEMSTTDMLTCTKSFEAFHIEAKKLIQSNPDKLYALITTDIERFKDINHTMGHDNGDKVIMDFSKVIMSDLDKSETIGRVSGDIFVILAVFNGHDAIEARIRIWNRMFQSSIRPLQIPWDVFIAAGVYPLNKDETKISSMIDKANTARKLGKGTRENSIFFYDEALDKRLKLEKELESSMVDSLKNKDYIIYLQPKINLANGKIAGAEALVRWIHPKLGFIMPSDFIPLFERNNFIIDVDFYVFENVCMLLRKWLDQGASVVPISVNFSRIHLLMQDFIPRLIEISKRYDISPKLLEVEITESAFIDKKSDIFNVTNELKQHGFTVSLDDFGAGYSSLNTLKDIPIDVLKLDKDFFHKETITDKEKIIVRSFVEMAKQMNISVVSEGVETELHADFLREISCDLAQGYHFEKPIIIEEFEKNYIYNS